MLFRSSLCSLPAALIPSCEALRGVPNAQCEKYQHAIAGGNARIQNLGTMPRLWKRRNDREDLSESERSESKRRVEQAQLEIAEMAGRASERAASTIAVAVKVLKEEVERLFVEARRNAGPAVQLPAAVQARADVDEGFTSVEEGGPPRADDSTAGEDSPDSPIARE